MADKAASVLCGLHGGQPERVITFNQPNICDFAVSRP